MNWQILSKASKDIIETLLKNRGIKDKKEFFLRRCPGCGEMFSATRPSMCFDCRSKEAAHIDQLRKYYDNNPECDWEMLTKGTALANWKRATNWDEAKEIALGFQPEKREGVPWGLVDHAFEVKGIGSVALGILKRGTIRVHDKLKFFPKGLDCDVRSIQVHDVDVKEAAYGDRFGVCFKGTPSSQVDRGFVISSEAKTGKELEVELEATKFLREPLKDGETLHACVGLQVEPCKMAVADGLRAGEKKKAKIVLEKEIAWTPGEVMVLVRLNATGLRFVARAIL